MQCLLVGMQISDVETLVQGLAVIKSAMIVDLVSMHAYTFVEA